MCVLLVRARWSAVVGVRSVGKLASGVSIWNALTVLYPVVFPAPTTADFAGL